MEVIEIKKDEMRNFLNGIARESICDPDPFWPIKRPLLHINAQKY
jgi:hypothetical protein